MKKIIIACPIFISIFIFSLQLSAQSSDSSSKKLYKPNIIKINLSSFVLYKPNFLLTYERAVDQHKSFSVEAGYITLPKLIGSVSNDFNVSDDNKRSGFKFDADFRFYFKKENKFTAPHGLYWGPYAAFYYFKNERTLTALDTSIATGTLNFTTTIQSPQLGVELGYQFSTLNDHLTIDLLLVGPAVAWYKAKLNLTGDFDPNEENAYLNDLLNLLIDNFPVINNLVENHEVSTSGVADLFAIGYRYSVSVGYRF